jgi:hypothetical protein
MHLGGLPKKQHEKKTDPASLDSSWPKAIWICLLLQLNNTVAGGFLKFKLFQKQKMCFAKRTPIQTHFSEKPSQAKTL